MYIHHMTHLLAASDSTKLDAFLAEASFMDMLGRVAGIMFWLMPWLAFLATVAGLIIWLVNRNPSNPRNSDRSRKVGKIIFFVSLGVWIVSIVLGGILLQNWQSWREINCGYVDGIEMCLGPAGTSY